MKHFLTNLFHVMGPSQISTVSGELRYLDALRLLYTLEDASKGLASDICYVADIVKIITRHPYCWCCTFTCATNLR